MAINDALELVFLRNRFYRRQYLMALSAFGLALVVIGVLVWMLLYLLRNPTHPLYFATDNVGRLIPIIPVDRPNMSNDDVSAWAIEAVQAAYSYDYINYRAQLQDSQKYFTNYGWTKYMSALTASNNLLALTQRKLIQTAVVVDKPKILAQGILSGAYAWRFQMPMLVTYSPPPFNDASKYSNALIVSVIVQRQSVLQSYKGLGIVQMIATSASTGPSQPQELSNTPT